MQNTLGKITFGAGVVDTFVEVPRWDLSYILERFEEVGDPMTYFSGTKQGNYAGAWVLFTVIIRRTENGIDISRGEFYNENEAPNSID